MMRQALSSNAGCSLSLTSLKLGVKAEPILPLCFCWVVGGVSITCGDAQVKAGSMDLSAQEQTGHDFMGSGLLCISGHFTYSQNILECHMQLQLHTQRKTW